MLGSAFNSILRLHSRAAQLKRPGSPDIFSPCRITPSNYFQFKKGPEYTDIHGREFIIPVSTMSGQFAQRISFQATPVVGTFKLSFTSLATTALAYNVAAADVQTALRALSGLAAVTVSGSVADGFVVLFVGSSTEQVLILPTDTSTLLDADAAAVTVTSQQTFSAWTAPIVRRGDKILDPTVYGNITIESVHEIPDLGGGIMGFRVRTE